MEGDTDPDTSRTVVQTYLPAYQREEWDDHAEELGMSRSEFVKAMVQAGRRGFGADVDATGDEPSEGPAEPGKTLEERVLDELEAGECLSWEELLAAVTDDVETRLEGTLQRLQAEDRVRYSGRNGGYMRDESHE